jgi:hypothetical protein
MRFEEGITQAREKKEAKKRKLAEPFKLTVGTCACKGTVVFDFKGYHTVGQVRFGGDNEMEEAFRLNCVACGALFDREHPPIDAAIKAYRDAL